MGHVPVEHCPWALLRSTIHAEERLPCINTHNINLTDRLRVTDQERAAIRSQFDTCIFVGETLEVECASSDPTAVLALMSEDGTMYVNGTASFEVTLDNINAANMTFLCSITNAPGPCGGFVFRSAVVAYGKLYIRVA